MLPWRLVEKSQTTDRIRPSMDIQIILPEDVSASKSNREPLVRHCGDEIQGNLKVVTCGNFDFEIYLSFEGMLVPIILSSEVINIEYRPCTDVDWVRK
jgi:hypothetical protein